ncbi:MAG: S-adenosylmethionine:tRNA ribosyltransferase-isomerase [Bacteroidales bacterium]|jgi:S-adenosylmethionine:tRNA ribosyltransferase-isomerase|nr:S-adenosylmethionine:tRNA ribosyltransferase-isomerase [Bacteroidales bacterium]
MLEKIHIERYNYDLPYDKIALYPTKNRDLSKLLIYSNGNIIQDIFRNIINYLPENSWLIFNDTKVVHARLIFYKETKAKIELFCLEPSEGDITTQLSSKQSVKWKCLVGNSRKWKTGILKSELKINDKDIVLTAERIETNNEFSIINFSWNYDYSFAEILEIFGKIPLPPYINRESEDSDNTTYQTIYANIDGSVAAPTAGLHFTSELMSEILFAGMDISTITLHVGAGTFKPVSSESINEHVMHAEKIIISRKFIEDLYNNFGEKYIIPIGTTSCRSIESLYWLGLKLENESFRENDELFLEQWYPYLEETSKSNISIKKSLENILLYMQKRNSNYFQAATSLIITPGYSMKFPNALITNFHQPKSTLLLLIAAAIGDDWKKLYDYALVNDFRFLSYGDSCLLKF